MAFADFTFPQVQRTLGLAVNEADLCSPLPAVPLREDFITTLTDGAAIALAINTEKAKSEFIIAPVLLELRRLLGGAWGCSLAWRWTWTPARASPACAILLSRKPRASSSSVRRS